MRTVVRSKDVDFIETKMYGDVIKEEKGKEIDFGEERTEFSDCKECEKGVLTRSQARKLEFLEKEKHEGENNQREIEADQFNKIFERLESTSKFDKEEYKKESYDDLPNKSEPWMNVLNEKDEVESFKNEKRHKLIRHQLCISLQKKK